MGVCYTNSIMLIHLRFVIATILAVAGIVLSNFVFAQTGNSPTDDDSISFADYLAADGIEIKTRADCWKNYNACVNLVEKYKTVMVPDNYENDMIRCEADLRNCFKYIALPKTDTCEDRVARAQKIIEQCADNLPRRLRKLLPGGLKVKLVCGTIGGRTQIMVLLPPAEEAVRI